LFRMTDASSVNEKCCRAAAGYTACLAIKWLLVAKSGA
jgi:hypothetical protein